MVGKTYTNTDTQIHIKKLAENQMCHDKEGVLRKRLYRGLQMYTQRIIAESTAHTQLDVSNKMKHFTCVLECIQVGFCIEIDREIVNENH